MTSSQPEMIRESGSRFAAPVDFPGWMPAMLVKEIRQALRTKGFITIFVGFHLIAVIAFWWSIDLTVATRSQDTVTALNSVFWGLLNFILLLVLPLRGIGALHPEMNSRTFDLLVLTRLTTWRIVLGKWGSLVAQAGLFLLAMLPYGVARYFFGSVNLVDDLKTMGRAAVLCVAFSAIALWISTMAKWVRVLIPIILILVVSGYGLSGLTAALFASRRYGGAGTFPTLFSGAGDVAMWMSAVVGLASLGLAVRRLAPRAENHAQVARAFALALLVVLFVLGALYILSPPNALITALLVVLLVGTLEVAHDRRPLNSHWRPWAARGFVGRWVGRTLLPGWCSATLFFAFALAATAVPTIFLSDWRVPGTTGVSYLWWLALGWQALVFPALLLSFLPASSPLRLEGTCYFLLQGLFGTVSIISSSNSASFLVNHEFARALDTLCRVLPISSFWLSAAPTPSVFTPALVIAQGVVLAITIALVIRQSRSYWRAVARFDRPTEGEIPQP